MNITPYLTFQGNAEEAMRFYAEVFGGEIVELRRYADMPGGQTPEHYRDKVLHGRLKIGDAWLFFSDAFSRDPVPPVPGPISLTIEFSDEAQIEAVYERLSQGGEVRMPLQKTFWGAKYAKLTDRFGITWDLNCQL
jgi:PhnB protein